MQEKPLVSVIIPVYNVEKYLRECIDSVLNQTYTNYEIILVDDGSTDSSGAICDEYAQNNDCITVVHKQNEGQSKTRNIGFAKSKGEYIYFLDSDDYISDDALEILLKTIQNDNSDFVFFNALSFDEENGFNIKQNYLRHNAYKTDSGVKVFTELQNNREYHCSIPLMFFSRSFYQRAKLSFLCGVYFEDMLFAYQAFCEATRVSYCNKNLYYRRYRANSTMTSSKTMKYYWSSKTVCLAVKEYTEQIGVTEKDFAQEYVTRCAMNVFNIYERLNNQDKRKCKEDLSFFRKSILNDNSYTDKSLRSRCYGKLFWFVYKVYEKTAGKLLRG